LAMAGLTPLRDFMSLRETMDRLFDDRWISPGSWLTWTAVGTQYLPLDVYETADEFVVRAQVPGVKPEAIDVQYQQGVLTIRTRTEARPLPDGATWLVNEIGAGQSVRQITLPRTVDVDKATTRFEAGVLTLTLPKTADARPKQIKVVATPQIGAGDGRSS
jgi:HSP20 family protein